MILRTPPAASPPVAQHPRNRRLILRPARTPEVWCQRPTPNR